MIFHVGIQDKMYTKRLVGHPRPYSSVCNKAFKKQRKSSHEPELLFRLDSVGCPVGPHKQSTHRGLVLVGV